MNRKLLSSGGVTFSERSRAAEIACLLFAVTELHFFIVQCILLDASCKSFQFMQSWQND